MCSSPNFEILKSSFSQGTERQIYEFVVRHFLACCSKVWIYMHNIGVYVSIIIKQNAEGQETTVEIDIAGEKVFIYKHFHIVLV